MEIQKQTHSAIHQSKIRQQLCIVNSGQPLGRLNFNNHKVVYDYIQPIAPMICSVIALS